MSPLLVLYGKRNQKRLIEWSARSMPNFVRKVNNHKKLV